MRPARLVALPPVAMAGPRPSVLLALLLITAPNVLLYAGTAALLPLVVLSCFSDGLDVVPQSLLIARWSGSRRSISTRSATMMSGLPIAVAAVIWSQTAPGQLEGGSWRSTAVGLVLGVLTTATYAVRPSAGIIYGDRCALARRAGRTSCVRQGVRRQPVVVDVRRLGGQHSDRGRGRADVRLRRIGRHPLGGLRGSCPGLIMGCARLLHRAGNIVTADTRVNSLLYASPALAAIWLTLSQATPSTSLCCSQAGMAVIFGLNAAIAADRSETAISPAAVTPPFLHRRGQTADPRRRVGPAASKGWVRRTGRAALGVSRRRGRRLHGS